MTHELKNSFLKIFLVVVGLLIAAEAWVFDIDTHRRLNGRAADASKIDNYLKQELGFGLGLKETFSERQVREWIQRGGEAEDQFLGSDVLGALLRSRHHFHNPLRGWDQAGLNALSLCPPFILQGEASVRWAQEPNQGISGQAAWADARSAFKDGLTLSSKTERENALARTFQILGQQMHLISDMAVPAHTRNDPHCPRPEGFEAWAARNPTLIEVLLPSQPVVPDASIFTIGVPIPDSIAKVPVARLWDTDQYIGSNPDISLVPTIGLSEYTNANFFSDDTVFKGFPFPAKTSMILRDQPEPQPRTGQLRRYFKKFRDGDTVEHVAVPSALYKFLPDALKDKKIGLDDRVFQDYAEKLLPRAVGYSAGLLDYFFRGKLDVDLVPDPNSSDPTVVKLSGTNGSPDKLDGGALTLYADDPITGERSLVPALEPNFTVVADKGQPVESAKFQINAEAERFMAVYKGKLGNEAPQGDFPGGVIGKALGGVRAESIFPQGDKRMLRTVPVNGVGIFPLPAAADRLENIQWGDQDNTFVGILSNPGTPRSPDQILAFRINRPLGSGEAPLVDGPGGTQVVSADILKAVNFPFDLSLGVTVNYSQTFRVQQARLAFDVIDTNVFDENQQTYNLFRQVSSPIVQTVLDQTIPFSQSFPIVLDHAHHCSQSCFLVGADDFPFFIGPIIRPYIWRVREVTLDQQGRLLALVDVILIEPDNRTRTGFLAETDIFGQGRWTVVAGFQVSALLRGVIDVDNGNVLGVTSSPTLSLSSQHTISFTSLNQHRVTTHIGGPLGGTTNETEILGRFSSGNPNFTTVETGTARVPTAGLLSEAILGRFRTDLEPLITVPTGIGTREFAFPLVYFVDDVTKTNKSIRVARTSSFSTGTIMPLPQAQMIRLTTGVSPQVLLLFSQQVPGSFVFQAEGIPVRWSPQSPANTALALSYKLPPVDSYSLLFTTSQAALLHFGDFGVPDPQLGPGVFTLLVDFTTQQTQTFPGLLGFQYVLLDPKFLYNLNDTKFHTLDLSLRRTALPRRLADAVPFRPPTAAYHLIKLQ